MVSYSVYHGLQVANDSIHINGVDCIRINWTGTCDGLLNEALVILVGLVIAFAVNSHWYNWVAQSVVNMQSKSLINIA